MTTETKTKTKVVYAADGTPEIYRFSTPRRIEHVIVFTSFTLLALTGLPQKFYGAGWADTLLNVFGGLQSARYIHRVAGWTFAIMAVLHAAAIVIGAIRGRMRMTLLPVPQDLRDAVANLRYYFGYTKTPPKLPVFDYRQKFEYMGMVLGGVVMILTGLILIFPTQLGAFLPGEIIAASRVAHSNEAMLAILVLAIWHVYGSHLSPDVFPMDKSIFTGKMTVEDLKHHHRLEFERLFPDGFPGLEDHDAPEPGEHGDDSPAGAGA